MTIPRQEHPRPDFEREAWLNLNGTWEFEIDHGATGEERGFFERESLNGTITLPFCPESKLSGVGYTDFMACVWYRREVKIPTAWHGKRVLFHIDASDYHTKVWANGTFVGEHRGGYTPFFVDITDQIRNDSVVLSVCANDDNRSHKQAAGKQSRQSASFGCYYTRTTGIWQTVWLEAVDAAHIVSAKYTADIEAPAVSVMMSFSEQAQGMKVTAAASYEGREVGAVSTTVSGKAVTVTVPLSEKHLWEVGNGRLYDLTLTLTKDGETVDDVKSYFGLRSVGFDGRRFLLNGKSVFQRFVLDQGFYPDGIYTAPTDEALKHDIEISKSLGFNGARLHQKVFEPRFLYWCDKLGYLVWGEYGNWGLQFVSYDPVAFLANEFLESVERDFNHPAIIGWCPLNEVWETEFRPLNREAIRLIYELTVKADPTRLVIDCSGGTYVCGPAYDFHDYEQNVEVFRDRMEHLMDADHGDRGFPFHMTRFPKDGEPIFVSEFGGIGWCVGENGWGYGNGPKTEEEFFTRYEGLTKALLDQPHIFGFCYTQLTDVEQEQNGLVYYDRTPKFDFARIAAANTRKAAIED